MNRSVRLTIGWREDPAVGRDCPEADRAPKEERGRRGVCEYCEYCWRFSESFDVEFLHLQRSNASSRCKEAGVETLFLYLRCSRLHFVSGRSEQKVKAVYWEAHMLCCILGMVST